MDVGSHGIVIDSIRSINVAEGNPITPLCYVDGNWAQLTQLG